MLSSGSPPVSVTLPALGRRRPAIRRRSDDLPAPFGPVTASTCPPRSVKHTLRKTWRPALTQDRSIAESSITLFPFSEWGLASGAKRRTCSAERLLDRLEWPPDWARRAGNGPAV